MTAGEAWTGSWQTDATAKRRAWAATTPAERLAWLEDALDFALAVGALQQERRRRGATGWPSAPPQAAGSRRTPNAAQAPTDP